MTETKTPPRKNGQKILFVAIIAVLLGLYGILLYWGVDTEKKLEASQEVTEQQAETIAEKEQELDQLEQRFQAEIEKAQEMGLEITDLKTALESIKEEKEKLKKDNRNRQSKINALSSKISGYQELLEKRDKDIADLRAQTEKQHEQIQELKGNISEREDNLSEVRNELDEKNAQIKLAQVLSVREFKVKGKNKKGKIKFEEDQEYRSKDIETLLIDFELAPNKVADVESKTVYMQLHEPSGATVSDALLGGGEFDAEGGTQLYTSKQDVLYENDGTQMTFSFQPNEYEYKAGRYSVDIFCEGHKIGTGFFRVK